MLGAGFVKLKDQSAVKFAAFNHVNRDMFEEKEMYEIIDHRRNSSHTVGGEVVDFKAAINLLIN